MGPDEPVLHFFFLLKENLVCFVLHSISAYFVINDISETIV